MYPKFKMAVTLPAQSHIATCKRSFVLLHGTSSPSRPTQHIRIFQASVVIFWIWTRTLNPFAIKTWLQSTPNCTVHRTQFGPTLVYIKWDQIRVFSRAHLGYTTYIPLLLPASQDGLDICSVCLHLRSLHGMWLVQHWVHYNCPPLTAGWLIL